MKKELKEIFNSLPNMGDGSAEQFISILELEDEVFDAVYPSFKDNLTSIFKTKQFQEQMLSQMKFYPNTKYEDEKTGIENLLKEIDSDDSLSANKKEMLRIIFESTLELYKTLSETGRENIEVQVYRENSEIILPSYAHPTDAGADISAKENTTIPAGQTVIVKTGLYVAIPVGYEIQLRPRSGLSAKTGLRIANAPATIDSDYRGEIGIIITNTSNEDYQIKKNDRLAQMVISPVPMISWIEVKTKDDLGNTNRGNGGFGSTGS